MMETIDPRSPVTPLPNPGEGGPVAPGGGIPSIPSGPSGSIPSIPLPNPGEGGPVDGTPSTPSIPIIPLPNPGEGGPVAPGGGGVVVLPTRSARTRFLNAAFGYRPFRILINGFRVVNVLGYGGLTAYGRVPLGYQTVTVVGTDGYVYLQKAMPFQSGDPTTIAIINTANGLDLLQIQDMCCAPAGNSANFRVSNLAMNSRPLDVLLGDGRVVYTDVRFKETTVFKRIRPGAYQFLFAETNLSAMPTYMDIETLDAAFIGLYPTMETVASLYLSVQPGVNYTVYLLSSGTSVNAVQTLVAADR